MGLLAQITGTVRKHPIRSRPPQKKIETVSTGTTLENLNGEATAHARAGRYGEAIRCYDRILAIDPNQVRAWINKGNCLCNLRRYDEALGCYDLAIALQPRDPLFRTNRGIALERMGRAREAIRCFTEAIELDPGCIEAWKARGRTCQRMGMVAEARVCERQVQALEQQAAIET
ncbi:MAG: tetratricopeptide repeat protein [Methanomicrobiales archaeon]|nr:tetratricopeptide repeat protein [Methanomicrobiales archaeon]MDI6875585.1 tetratricopeptide repeat protein [Methanomicrobiales archaeon]